MKELTIYNLTGWMNGLYNISNENQIYDAARNFFDVNNLFWTDLFSKQTIELTINKAIKTFSIHDNVSDKVFKYYQFYGEQNEKEYKDFIQNIKKLSMYDIELSAEYPERLLTLSTCEYSQEDGRFVVVAKKVN